MIVKLFPFSGLNCPISDEDMMQVNQGNKTNPNTAGILGNTGVDPLRKKSGCQDEDSINEVLYAAQVNYCVFCSKMVSLFQT